MSNGAAAPFAARHRGRDQLDGRRVQHDETAHLVRGAGAAGALLHPAHGSDAHGRGRIAKPQQVGRNIGRQVAHGRLVLRRLREQAAEDRPGKPGQRPHAPRALKRLCRPAPKAQRPGKAERQPDRGGRSLQCGGRQRAGLPREHRRAERKQHHSRPDPSHDHRVPLPDIFCSTIWKAFPNFA